MKDFKQFLIEETLDEKTAKSKKKKQKYQVWNCFDSAEWEYDTRISSFYKDSFDLGMFASDAEAIKACEARQSADDKKALRGLRVKDLGSNGPSYVNHLYRCEEDGEDVKVEL